MRYIRTKNGIFDTTKLIYAFSEDYVSKDWNKDFEKLLQTSILKQADAIEVLCDEFVWREMTFDKGKDYEDNDCLINQDYERDEHEITQEMIIEGIYGAIWTDKGLIYVAKMNRKGNLELL